MVQDEDEDDDDVSTGNVSVSGNGSSATVGLLNLGAFDQTVALGGSLPKQTDLKVPRGNNIDIFMI